MSDFHDKDTGLDLSYVKPGMRFFKFHTITYFLVSSSCLLGSSGASYIPGRDSRPHPPGSLLQPREKIDGAVQSVALPAN